MLPLSVKVVWLVFAVLGIPATWFVFIPFASAIGTYWAAVLYCITVTVLEVTFCLGMVWKMNPSSMPHTFCVVQTVIIALCFHVLTGVCACFTWASYLTVFKPYRSIQASASALLWRRTYYFFVVAFPLVAFTTHLVAVLKTNSVHPTDDMHCDNTSPLWPRLLGYAGAPILLFTPCFLLSIVTAIRIIGMQAQMRQLHAQIGDSRLSARAGSRSSRISTSRRLAATPLSGVSDKHPTTLDGQNLTVDVRLQGSSTRSSSRVSLSGTVETNTSTAHVPIELPSLSPLGIPSAYLSQPSPQSSTENQSVPEIERFRTPSPIVFAHAPTPSPHNRHTQLHSAEHCDNHDCEGGTAPAPRAAVSQESLTAPASPSRAPISLDAGERMPRFHLPTWSPPHGLRPSLELSPEYVRVRLEEDRAILAGCSEGRPVSSCSSYRPPISTLSTGKCSSVIGSLPSITYADRALEGLPETDEAEKGSIAKTEGGYADERKVVSPEPSPLKPERQFYRSAPRPSIGRPPGLDPAIWRMVVYQLVFFFILILASLSTVIDLIGHRTSPTSFGTQHIAILLVAWCPVIVFGYRPGVRNPFLARHCCA